jgi:RimJ/RimL family protein N-acetyltransferase
MEGVLAGDFAVASSVAGFEISPSFDYGVEHFELRFQQVRADPAWAPWLTRAVVVKATNVAAGHAGLHGPPGLNSLDDPAGVEIGYTIMEPHRRQGFAEEAARGLFAWAATQPGVKRGYASVAPSNGPSLRLSAKLGMKYLTEVWDDDGPEHVFWSDLPLSAR